MGYITVAVANDIPVGGRKLVKVDDNEVLVVNVEGEWYAVGTACPHNPKNSLADGPLDGAIITCTADGTQFDVRTGKNTLGLKWAFGRKTVKDLRTYGVRIEGSSVRLQCL